MKLDGIQRCFLMDFCDIAYLGGGAVRDTVLNKPIRDYDFYIADDPKAIKALKDLGFKEIRPSDKKYDDPNIKTVLKHKNFDIIITTGSPLKVIARFCINISRIYADFDKDLNISGIVKSPSFLDFERTGVIKLHLDAHLKGNIREYLLKIHDKYPECKMEVCFK